MTQPLSPTERAGAISLLHDGLKDLGDMSDIMASTPIDQISLSMYKETIIKIREASVLMGKMSENLIKLSTLIYDNES